MMPADPAQAVARQIAEQLLVVEIKRIIGEDRWVTWQVDRFHATNLIARALTDARGAVWEEAINALDVVCDTSSGDSQRGLLKGISALRQRAAAEEGAK